MSDAAIMKALAERLRERAESYRMGGPSAEHTAAMLEEAATALEAAAAEIERLRGGVATERERCAVIVEDEMPATQDMESTLICEALERAAARIRSAMGGEHE